MTVWMWDGEGQCYVRSYYKIITFGGKLQDKGDNSSRQGECFLMAPLERGCPHLR